jgi:hypothetical protein
MEMRAIALGIALGFVSMGSHAASYFIKAPQKSLSPFGGEGNAIIIAQRTVGPGAWFVSAKASPVNRVIPGTVATGSQDITRCGIYVGDNRLDLSSTHLGDGPTVGGSLPAVATVYNQIKLTVPAGARQTIYYKCWHDYDVDGQYLDPNASLYIGTAP